MPAWRLKNVVKPPTSWNPRRQAQPLTGRPVWAKQPLGFEQEALVEEHCGAGGGTWCGDLRRGGAGEEAGPEEDQRADAHVGVRPGGAPCPAGPTRRCPAPAGGSGSPLRGCWFRTRTRPTRGSRDAAAGRGGGRHLSLAVRRNRGLPLRTPTRPRAGGAGADPALQDVLEEVEDAVEDEAGMGVFGNSRCSVRKAWAVAVRALACGSLGGRVDGVGRDTGANGQHIVQAPVTKRAAKGGVGPVRRVGEHDVPPGRRPCHRLRGPVRLPARRRGRRARDEHRPAAPGQCSMSTTAWRRTRSKAWMAVHAVMVQGIGLLAAGRADASWPAGRHGSSSWCRRGPVRQGGWPTRTAPLGRVDTGRDRNRHAAAPALGARMIEELITVPRELVLDGGCHRQQRRADTEPSGDLP